VLIAEITNGITPITEDGWKGPVTITAEDVATPAAALGGLSTRERELIALVALGRTDAEIAAKLFISVSTVRTHLDRIRDKSAAAGADLTRLALQEGSSSLPAAHASP
jgi:DNA-binding CsgD family transcriptional regulator